MERFNLKKFNAVEAKEWYQDMTQISLHLWKTLMMMIWTSTGLRKSLERM
jgi:hypothetical protein